MPMYYKIIYEIDVNIYEVLAPDGTWYCFNGIDRAEAHFPTIEAANQTLVAYYYAHEHELFKIQSFQD